MKENEKIDVSFAGDAQETRVKNVGMRGKEAKKFLREMKVEDVVLENIPELAPSTKEMAIEEISEPLDPFELAIEAFFAGYQTFQEGMNALKKFTQPQLVFGKLMVVLDGFQEVINEFKEADFVVPTKFQKGQDLMLEGIAKYEVFLVEYPAVLKGQPGGRLKAMKKVAKLGKLSADADQDMKKAFRAFDEATQGA